MAVKKKIGIVTKFVLPIQFTVFFMAVVFGLATSFILRGYIQEKTHIEMSSLSSLKERNIQYFLDDAKLEMIYMNNRAGVREALIRYLGQGEESGKGAVKVRLEEIVEIKKVFSEMMVLDTDGVVVIATNTLDEGKVKIDEEYFINSLTDTYLQSYFYDLSSEKPAMMVGTPIKDDDGNLLGVLAGKINVERIGTLLSDRAGYGETGESFLINSTNLVVTDLLKEPDHVFKKTIFRPQIITCLEGRSSEYVGVDYFDDQVLGYYRWMPELSSCLVSKIDYSEAFAPINEILISLLIILLAGAGVMGILGYIVALSVVGPIRKLHDSVKLFKEGDFGVQSEVITNDEVGEMAQTFNEMAGKIKVSYIDMEKKISDKTKELQEKLEEQEKMNRLMVDREIKMIELKKDNAELKAKKK